MDFFTFLLPTVEHAGNAGYLLLFFVVLIESLPGIGFFVPSTVVVALGGFLAAQGLLNLEDVILFSAAGGVIGEVITFLLGRRMFNIKRSTTGASFTKKLLTKGRQFFKRHGSKGIFFSQFAGVSSIVSFAAGSMRMNARAFFLWAVSGTAVWSICAAFLGFFFGNAWDAVSIWTTRAEFLLAILFTAAITAYIARTMLVKYGKEAFVLACSIYRSAARGIAANRDFQKFIARHNLLFSFLKNRFRRDLFSGLPVTIFSIGAAYILILFGGIVEDIITSDKIVAADMHIANILVLFRDPRLTNIFLKITLLGKWQIIFGFASAAVGILYIWRKRCFIAPLLIAITGSEIFTALGKIAFHRARPELAVYTEHSFSFPSGHAAIAVAFYGFLIYIFIRNFGLWKTKANLFFAGLFVILLVGFSRLYLGVHYISDVWGGYLLGALWLIISISVAEWLVLKKTNNTRLPYSVKTRAASAALISASILFYFIFGANYQPQILQNKTSQEKILVKSINSIFPNEQLKYTETLIGEKQEPISFIILAENNEQFIQSFVNSGWFLADKINAGSIVKLALAALSKQAYATAPITPSFWNVQTNDFAFEKPTKLNTVIERHHARFWKTNYTTKNGKIVYVGTASLDSGIKWMITHRIHPDIDTEREFLFNSLRSGGIIANFQKQKFVKPALGKNFSGDQFFTDGEVYKIILTNDTNGDKYNIF